MFIDYMKEQGIKVQKSIFDEIDEIGRHYKLMKERQVDAAPFEEKEFVLYSIKVRDAEIAFPSNGIGIRIMIPSKDKAFMDSLDKRSTGILAIASDGEEYYILDDMGEIDSSNPIWDKKKMFDTVKYCLDQADKYFTKEEIRRRVLTDYNNGIIRFRSFYYDANYKKFFVVSVDGNYYHGYDVSYHNITKSQAIHMETDFHLSIDDFVDECRRGEIPTLVILNELSYVEGDYTPPYNFGYGTEFI